MGDFLFRFFTAESKRDYFFRNWGWADLLANTFLSPQQEQKEEIEGISGARLQIEEFRKLLDEQEKTNAALKAKFELLENLIELG